jgi:glycosyltransferase involved in cell wall biosynthesis
MGAAGGPCWDAVYANVWPLFGQCGVVRAAQRLGAPVVLHVQDVYPESLAIKLPPRVYRWLAPWLVALDRAIARRCAAVVLVSARMRDTYVRSRRVAARAEVVRNWVDASPFATAYDRAAVCAEYRVPTDRFTFMYLGNLAALAALDTAIRAFAAASDGTQQFVVVGEGSAKAAYETLVRHLGLTHVLFRSEPDPAKVARVQSMADVLVLPMRCGGSLTSTPSKCISYLLSGKPIVAALDAESDVGDDLRHARCAWFCPPEDVAQLVGVLRKAAQCPPETRTAMGASGRAYALREFSRDTGLRRLVSIVEGVVRP